MLNKITLIILILVVVALGVFGYLYFTQEKTADTTNGVVATIRDFFPFGRGSTVSPQESQTESGSGTPATTGEPMPPPRLRQIYALPVSGAEVFTVASTTVVRFLEKSTGNVYEARTDVNTVERVSNTTIPKVTQALFVQKGSVLLRYLKDDSDLVETVFGSLSTTTNATGTVPATLAELTSVYLPPNIKDVVLSDKRDKMFYLTATNSGATGTLANPDSTKGAVIFESTLQEWAVQWPKVNTVALTTKPSAQVPGYLYFLDTVTGKQKRILGGLLGLTALANPDSTSVLYSQNDAYGNISLKTYKISTNTSSPTLSTPTLAEKCVWGKKNTNVAYCAIPKNIQKGQYPDFWYKGLVSFNDNIWKIDTSAGTTELILDIKDVSGKDVDAVNLSVDANETFLLFTNKKDLTLWSYAL